MEMVRTVRFFLAIASAAMVSLVVPMAAYADKLTESNMTQKDFKDLTETKSSVSGRSAIEKPFEMHDFSEATADAVKEAHGVRVVKGRDWKTMTPEQRDARMRELDRTMEEATFFLIEVPSGNVWVIGQEEYFKLKESNIIHRWSWAEKEKLPKAVKRDTGTTHSDIGGARTRIEIERREEP